MSAAAEPAGSRGIPRAGPKPALAEQIGKALLGMVAAATPVREAIAKRQQTAANQLARILRNL
jgi:hypothetical protein